MPTNKDALIRIKILDNLLSNKGRRYTWDELVDEVNDKLFDLDKTQVTRRCIEKDVAFIEAYFGGDVTKERIASESDRGRTVEKVRVFYEDSDFSIFSKKMSKEEAYLLKQVIRTLGQFDGLPDFSVVAGFVDSKFAKSFEDSIGDRQIVSFEKNPLEDTKNVFAKLFLASCAQCDMVLTSIGQISNPPEYKAAGGTPMGHAFTLIKDLVEDKNRISSRSYKPTIVLLTDGIPTDDYKTPMQSLIQEGRSSKAFRIAMAIGDDADKVMLSSFVSSPELLVTGENARDIRKFFKFVTMSVTSRMKSRTPDNPETITYNDDEIVL